MVDTPIMSIISSLSIIMISTLLVAIDGRSVLPSNVTIPALIGFGDSLIDPGNNNQISTLAKCNFPPYGKDFENARPTGRFSNGRIPTDLFAEKWGLKMYLPAYLNPHLKPKELLTGVSFASGGSGYDPLTSTVAMSSTNFDNYIVTIDYTLTGDTTNFISVISLSEQLDMYREYIGKLMTMVGPARTDFIVSNSVHLVVAGSNDIVLNYFGPITLRRTQYDFNAYADLMLTYASSFVKELYGLGARRIVVTSAPPVGCMPVARTLGGGLTRVCADDYNKVAQMFNSKLIVELESLRSSLLSAKIVYADIYYPALDIIRFPSKYGFEEVTRGCCGTGLIETVVLCNELDPVCPDDTKFMFWDSAHPTEKAYRIVVDTMINNISDLI